MPGSRRAKKAAMSGQEDRISALPDGVIQHILGFLPADEAVETSVLARRWRHLWRSMRRLRITYKDDRWECDNDFIKFVDGLLLLRHPGLALDEVELRVYPFDHEDGTFIKIWIRHALFCQAKVLVIDFDIDFPFTLDAPLLSQHLRRLELGYLGLKENSLDFARCPALEVLEITNCRLDTCRILSQSVKHLRIKNCDFFSPKRIRISAPNLVSLQICYFDGKAPLLEKMASLETAIFSIDIEDYCDKSAYGESCGDCLNCCSNNDHNSGDLLGGLSSATNLELITYSGALILRRWCPTFSRLKTLLLNMPGEDNDLHSLVCILERSPVLEKLTLQLSEEPQGTGESEGSYHPMEQLPAVSEHLNTVEIKCKEVDERVCKILKFLGRFIKHVNINLAGKP
ncbi:MEIOTIC F-BOX protein MOF-like [Phragmites australis]|uniref:MEIOTIC F-BOX protein MOF-like n=1 Tax=Phragmites australis TaxID=29695 RepID=UPI002D7941AE|nr:MEIOTIC F-BOX protein MOF-like [Phragmites australis]XP_062198223.1 MEIOTIC F-BOX protein MOF-like [Phragmites australis]